MIESTKIQEVEAAFSDALHRYREAATSMELCIAIRYQACKTYAKDKEGRTMFDSRSPYSLSVSFSDTPAIGFDFRLVIKKTVDGNSSWYDAEEKDEHLTWHQNQQDVSGYVTGSNIYSLRDYKVIPYSPEALATLQKGQETLRQMSEMLFKFISQDEALLEAALTGGKLLN